MSTLTYLLQAQIDDSIIELDGETLTRPALLVTDGIGITYACDVRIDDYDEPLRNVPVAANNNALTYAEAGSAVRLRRDATGRWQVVGFSKNKPGTWIQIEVDLDTYALGGDGTAVAVGISAKPFTYGQLATFGIYGEIPYGAIGIFRGEELMEIRS